jgi:nucleoid DNA-binding protein
MTQLKPKYDSERSFVENKNVDKRMLSRIVAEKFRGKIKFLHVMSVVNILFEELFRELLKNKFVIIGNFGSFIFKLLPPRRHYKVNSKQIVVSEGKQIIRFELDKKIHQILKDNLDVAKTFEGPNNR